MILWSEILKAREIHRRKRLLEMKAEEYRNLRKASEALDTSTIVNPEAKEICIKRQKIIKSYSGTKEKE